MTTAASADRRGAKRGQSVKGSSLDLLRDPNTSLVGTRNPHPYLTGLRLLYSVSLVFRSLTTMKRGALKKRY